MGEKTKNNRTEQKQSEIKLCMRCTPTNNNCFTKTHMENIVTGQQKKKKINK